MRGRKVCGPDLLPAKLVLKELASELSPFLTAIFQKSLDTEYVPTDCKDKRLDHCNFQDRGEIQGHYFNTSTSRYHFL